jgi:hypothetical protein
MFKMFALLLTFLGTIAFCVAIKVSIVFVQTGMYIEVIFYLLGVGAMCFGFKKATEKWLWRRE